ncbi:phosphotriesterase [Georgenia sp. SYP-B2076]|uniref:phosphotriesterase family protein n=1 Tax=Georgenia sp. SYP-B2076 TaxID=2495881 RepID=UPI000F8DEC5E|nr:phosphotriesterase [Georgenia sp. SYP-B2076]
MSAGPGYLQTVTGPVARADLGVVLPHEHLFNDLSGVVDEPSYDFSRVLVGAKVSASTMWALRQDPYASADNMADKPVADVVAEVRAFAEVGGRTIVDATGTPAIGRNPGRLRAVAEATGLNVVMSTGAYLEKFEGAAITGRSVDAQAQAIGDDLDHGVGEAGIRAGMIGEIGISPSFTDGEKASLRAAGLAQLNHPEVALNIHLPGWERYAHDVLDIVLGEVGVDPAKVSLAHADPSGDDPDYQHALLDRGVWLEFDMIGLDITFPKEGVSPTPVQTADAVTALIGAGYGGQLVLSHDLFLKQMWTQHGGNGWAFVPTVFLAMLRQRGVAEEMLGQLVRDNPARLLT